MKTEVLEILEVAATNAADNVYRANLKFKGMTAEQLDSKYVKSSQTCREILDGYKSKLKELERCIKWVKSQ